MKRLTVTALVILIGLGAAFAQKGPRYGEGHQGYGQGPLNLPGLTDDQKEQIETLRAENLKTMLPLRNTLQEKKARLMTLQSAEKADMKAINGLIDEISAIKTQMAKQRAAHHQQVRSVLTDEQRVVFDSRPRGMGRGHGHGKGHHGRGYNNCGNCRYNN